MDDFVDFIVKKQVQSNAFKESWSIKVTTKYIVIFRMINKVTDLLTDG